MFGDLEYPMELYSKQAGYSMDIIRLAELASVLLSKEPTAFPWKSAQDLTLPLIEVYARFIALKSIDNAKDNIQKESRLKETDSKTLKKPNLSNAAIIATSSTLTVASTYAAGRQISKLCFLEELDGAREVVRQAIVSIKYWIRERKSLNLPIPQQVAKDIRIIEDLMFYLSELGNNSSHASLGLSFLGGAFGGAVIAISTLMHSNIIQNIGIGTLTLSMLGGAAAYGFSSSSNYTELHKSYTLKARRICNILINDSETVGVQVQNELMASRSIKEARMEGSFVLVGDKDWVCDKCALMNAVGGNDQTCHECLAIKSEHTEVRKARTRAMNESNRVQASAQ